MKAAEQYIESYQVMGQPVIRCVTCGCRVKYKQADNGMWSPIFVGEGYHEKVKDRNYEHSVARGTFEVGNVSCKINIGVIFS